MKYDAKEIDFEGDVYGHGGNVGKLVNRSENGKSCDYRSKPRKYKGKNCKIQQMETVFLNVSLFHTDINSLVNEFF